MEEAGRLRAFSTLEGRGRGGGGAGAGRRPGTRALGLPLPLRQLIPWSVKVSACHLQHRAYQAEGTSCVQSWGAPEAPRNRPGGSGACREEPSLLQAKGRPPTLAETQLRVCWDWSQSPAFLVWSVDRNSGRHCASVRQHPGAHGSTSVPSARAITEPEAQALANLPRSQESPGAEDKCLGHPGRAAGVAMPGAQANMRRTNGGGPEDTFGPLHPPGRCRGHGENGTRFPKGKSFHPRMREET